MDNNYTDRVSKIFQRINDIQVISFQKSKNSGLVECWGRENDKIQDNWGGASEF